MKLIIPAYIYPILNSSEIESIVSLGGLAATVIINPNSGPYLERDPFYAALLRRIDLFTYSLGYVATGYGKKSLDLIIKEIEDYFTFYPLLSGIFFDEVASSKDKVKDFYTPLRKFVGENRKVVFNPGVIPDKELRDLLLSEKDRIILLETKFSKYILTNSKLLDAFPPWSRAAIVMKTLTTTEAKRALIKASGEFQINEVYLTDLDDSPNVNTFGRLPIKPIWDAQVNWVMSH